jgi:hypothetical protein
MVVALGRITGDRDVKFWRDDESTQRIRWIRVPSDTPPLPIPHCFEDPDQIGEREVEGVVEGMPGVLRRRVRGHGGIGPEWGPPVRFCGSPEAWLHGGRRGIDPPLEWGWDGRSSCCRGGAEIVGTPGVITEWAADGLALEDSPLYSVPSGDVHATAGFIAAEEIGGARLRMGMETPGSAPPPDAAYWGNDGEGHPYAQVFPGLARNFVLEDGPIPAGALLAAGAEPGLAVASRYLDTGAGPVHVDAPLAAEWLGHAMLDEPPAGEPGHVIIWSDSAGALWATYPDGRYEAIGLGLPQALAVGYPSGTEFLDVTDLWFDPADGFLLSAAGAGVVRVDLAPAGQAQNGIVTTGPQNWRGTKRIVAGPSPAFSSSLDLSPTLLEIYEPATPLLAQLSGPELFVYHGRAPTGTSSVGGYGGNAVRVKTSDLPFSNRLYHLPGIHFEMSTGAGGGADQVVSWMGDPFGNMLYARHNTPSAFSEIPAFVAAGGYYIWDGTTLTALTISGGQITGPIDGGVFP